MCVRAEDRQRGGHVLDAALLSGEARILPLYHTLTDLPHTQTWAHANFERDAAADVAAAEH